MGNLKKNISYQMAYKVLTVITPLITSPILSRALGPEGLGLYSGTMAYATYFTMFAMLGVNYYGDRSIAAVQDDIENRSKIFVNIYTVQACASLLALISYAISFVFIDSSRWWLAAIQGLWILSYLIDINWFFFGIEQFKITVIRNTIIKICTVIAIAIFIRTPDDLYLYAAIMGVGAVLSQVVLWFYLKKFVLFVKPSIGEVKKHILPILKLYVPVIAITLFRLLDKTMLDLLSSDQSLGFYYAADKMINIPLGVVTAVSTVMLPRIANMFQNKTIEEVKSLLIKSIELTVMLACAASFGIAAIAQEFVPLFFGPGYEECICLVYWFVPVLIIKTLDDIICSQYLIPAHKDNLYIISMFGGAAANIIANYFLIKQFAATGAVIGTIIAELIVLSIQIICVKEIRFLAYFFKQIQYVFFGIIMFLIVRGGSSIINAPVIIKIIILIAIGAIVYLVLCFIWSFINSDSIVNTERKKVINYIKRVKN